MILKDKMFVIAENIDDSIKSQTAVYDIRLFKSFVDFEKYVDITSIVLDTIIVTTNELPFTATNMARFLNVLKSPLLQVKGNIVYLIDRNCSYKDVMQFVEGNQLNNWAVYQGDLTVKFITDIVTGEGRQSAEGQTELVTYRIRASEYIKQQNLKKYDNSSNETYRYATDEELLEGIPNEEEPESINPTIDIGTQINYIVGNGLERTIMVFLLAQYFTLAGKTIIVERDWEYHTLTDMVAKSGVACELITIDEMLEDVNHVINKIKSTHEKLVVIGSKQRKKYNYNFIMDLLESNLKSSVSNIIRECDYSETPYGRNYTIVTQNTMPSVLKSCNSLSHDIDIHRVTFVGVQLGDLGPMNLSSKEMGAVIDTVLSKNGVPAQVVRVKGILLKGEDVVYDMLSILNRGNK